MKPSFILGAGITAFLISVVFFGYVLWSTSQSDTLFSQPTGNTLSRFGLLAGTAKPSPSVTPRPKPTVVTEPFRWGAYAGGFPKDLTAFETLVGNPVQIAATFVHWGNEKEFPTQFAPLVRDKNKTLLIFWEAKDYNIETTKQPNYSFDAILAGKWDSYFTEFAASTKAYQGKVILVPFSEMNGNWAPWSGTLNNNTPAKYITAYRYVRGFFKDVPNVKFGWAVNNESDPDTPENVFENYYPGDPYVDYVGVDGFNFDEPWQTWNEVFDTAIDRLEYYPKPIFIFSTASADGPLKAQWIESGLGTEVKKHPNVIGWIWFNENKEKDWRVNSNPQSLAAFKKITKP